MLKYDAEGFLPVAGLEYLVPVWVRTWSTSLTWAGSSSTTSIFLAMVIPLYPDSGPGEVKDIINQIQQASGIIQNVIEALSLLLIDFPRHFIQHQLGKANNNIERGTQVMGYIV